jgi:putative transposase
VDGETIRGYLNEQVRVDDLHSLEQQVNQALVAGLPHRLRKTKLEIAIDLHDEPFYGHRPELLALTCGGKAHKGTTRFFRVATAYVIFKDMRLTLGLLFVRPEDDIPDIVAALLRRLRLLGLKVRRLYLDKGFCSIPVLRYIEQSGWSAIIACPIRGKKGGTRGLCQGHKSYRTQHTFKSQPNGAFTAPVTVVRTYTSRKRSKRKKRRATWLVFVVFNCDVQPNSVRKLYRKRFGIEIVFTQMTKARVSAGFGGRDDVTDFDVGVIDNHSVNQQFHQFSFLVKGGLGQTLLDPLAESFNRRGDRVNLKLFMELGF